MPVRIYDIAKKLGIENKEVLAKAKELHISGAKVPSSTLDKITAEYLEQKLMEDHPLPPPPPAPIPVASPPAPTPPPAVTPVVQPEVVHVHTEPLHSPVVEHAKQTLPSETIAPTKGVETPKATEVVVETAPAIPASQIQELTATPLVPQIQPLQPVAEPVPPVTLSPEKIIEVAIKTSEPSAEKSAKDIVVPLPSHPVESVAPPLVPKHEIEPVELPEKPQVENIAAEIVVPETDAVPSEPEIVQSDILPDESVAASISEEVSITTDEVAISPVSVGETEELQVEAEKEAEKTELTQAILESSISDTAEQPAAVTAPAEPAVPLPAKVGDKVGFIDISKFVVRSADRRDTGKGAKGGDRKETKSQESKQGKQTPPSGSSPQKQGQGNAQKQGAWSPTGKPGPSAPAGKQGYQSKAPPGGGMPQKFSAKGAPPSAATPKFVPPLSGELITMKPPIIVRNLAELLKKKPYELIGGLIELGVFATVNQSIEEPIAQRLCAKYGFRFEVERRKSGAGIIHAPVKRQDLDVDDKPELLKSRPPVVTIMGHVDHGKTTLLDVIRKSNVVASEAGGITQHIGAYTISFPHPERHKEVQQITFLDTPGHAAFSAMRARGANVTDIVVLVVAANDGVMPQTVEAINHALAAKVTIMVAVNKCDHRDANPMRVRQQLQEYGLVCEEWGGNVIFCDVSALTKKGVDKLLEMIILQAEMMDLRANPNRPAKGNVIESGLEPGGPTATVLVRKGTLKVGNIILAGAYWGKARALVSEEGKRLKEAGPSVAVKLLGLNGVPEAGLEFLTVDDEKSAREMAEQRALQAKERGAETRPKVTLENLFATLSPDSAKVLKVVVKADTQGSVEAIVEALKKIESTKVSLEIIHSAVGIITESDVLLASASKAIILGFHTRVDAAATDATKREEVQIKLYSIIYELIDQVKDAMAGLLEPVTREAVLGVAEVRKIFSLSKGGNVAGCMVTSGRVVRGRCRVLRRKDLLFEGSTSSLRRYQDEVNEVRSGTECGIRIDGFNEFQAGDIIECYHIEKIPQKL